MDEIKQPKPVAELRWHGETPEDNKGLTETVRAQGIVVWLRCRHDSFSCSYVKAVLHPGGKPAEAQLLLVCPDCRDQLRIPGAEATNPPPRSPKTFEWYQNPYPQPVNVPGQPTAVNSVQLTIAEPWGCSQCGHKFRLIENGIGRA